MDTPLKILGWKTMSPDVMKKLEDHKKLVVIYPHTSHYDFFLYTLYAITDRTLFSRSKVLINPRFMNIPIMGNIAHMLGGIKSSSRRTKKGGKTKCIIESLNKMEEFIFLISPKGSIDPYEWRSGYYHIALGTGAEIVVAGFDFKKREFVYKEPFDPNGMTIEEVEVKAMNDLRDIYPCHPRYVEYPTTFSRDDPSVQLTEIWRIILFYFFIVVLVLIFLLLLLLVIYCIYKARK